MELHLPQPVRAVPANRQLLLPVYWAGRGEHSDEKSRILMKNDDGDNEELYIAHPGLHGSMGSLKTFELSYKWMTLNTI